jgi:hypothetical protein
MSNKGRRLEDYLKVLGGFLPYWLIQKMVHFKGNGSITLIYKEGNCVGYDIAESDTVFNPKSDMQEM